MTYGWCKPRPVRAESKAHTCVHTTRGHEQSMVSFWFFLYLSFFFCLFRLHTQPIAGLERGSSPECACTRCHHSAPLSTIHVSPIPLCVFFKCYSSLVITVKSTPQKFTHTHTHPHTYTHKHTHTHTLMRDKGKMKRQPVQGQCAQ